MWNDTGTDNMDEHVNNTDRLFRATKALRAIGLCLNALHKAENEIDWLKQVCTVLLQDTDFVMAWIGYTDNSPEKRVIPVAWAGQHTDYLDHIEITWADNRLGQGPTGKAIRTNLPSVMRDIPNHPEYQPWREQATSRGYSASVALPVCYDGTVLGVLNIYSDQGNAFDSSEVALLNEFAQEIGLGITFIRSRAAEARAIAQRSNSEHLFLSLINTLPQYIFLKSVDFTFLACNESCAKVMGLGNSMEIIGKKDEDFFSPEQVTKYRGDDIQVLEHGVTLDMEESYIFGGNEITIQTVKTPMRDDDGKITGILGISWDITQRKRSEIELENSNRALKTLSIVNRLIVHRDDESSLPREICKAIVELNDYPLAWVGFLDSGSTYSLEIIAIAGIEAESLKQSRLSISAEESTARIIFREHMAVTHENMADAPFFRQLQSNTGTLNYTAGITMPLEHAGSVFGLLQVYTGNTQRFSTIETALLNEMAEDLAYGISNIRLKASHEKALLENTAHLRKIRDNLKATIAAISSSIEARDPYTAGHQQRVAVLAAAIARKMGLDENCIEGIHMGAMIHDIGKLQIPAEILSKPSRLSTVEYELIKQHPAVGYNILRNIDSPWPLAEIAWQHHERYDGSGYPQGFKGEEIILEARIVAVADTVEAMSSHRPYRPGLSIKLAIDEIITNSGRLYDPAVVEACVALYKDGFELTS